MSSGVQFASRFICIASLLFMGSVLCSPAVAFGAASPEGAGAPGSVPAASVPADAARADLPAEKDASLPAGVPESWWSQVQRRIAEEE
ncbi:MAG TPA: hypothetical protein PLX03_12700, partial [Candidatus Hydrogenedentes bacterium]|nr:hypothetical protein [Candidatus Hydrogenedentota bacterium]